MLGWVLVVVLDWLTLVASCAYARAVWQVYYLLGRRVERVAMLGVPLIVSGAVRLGYGLTFASVYAAWLGLVRRAWIGGSRVAQALPVQPTMLLLARLGCLAASIY